jgi:DNA-binding SARP family transcriptional activator
VAEPGLSIALLGPPVVEADGRPLVVDTRKATALLAYLAIEGHPVRRDTLASLLWPENDPERARSALRRTLSTLRTALGSRWLETSRDLVSLGGDGVRLDVADLRALAAECATHGHASTETCGKCLEPLRKAVALDRGPFLSGFHLRDSAEFDDWQQLTTDALGRELGAVLDRLADAAAAAGDHAQAIASARRRLALDPLHEPAHRRLIQVYAASGDRSAALEQYRDCVRVLDRELGVRPLDETTSLYHAVLEGTYAAAPAAAPPPPLTEPEPVPALVGRGRELDALLEAYRSVGPDGRLAVVVGEAGIGKTRLADELLAGVAANGGSTISARCFQEESELAYGVVTQLLRDAVAAGGPPGDASWWAEEVARLLPELGPPPERAVDSTAAEARFYEAVCEFLLRTVAGAPPPAVFVDDAHWADEASLRLLLFLAHRLAGRPLLLVVGWEPEAVPPGSPIVRLLADLRRRRAARVLALERLTAAEVAELVAARGHDGELAARLHRESGGLPFFVVEYLDALGRDGADATEWPVPGGIRELLGARLARLGELAAQVVAAAAVLGRAFDPDALRDASGRSEEEVVAAVEELEARGVLVEGEHGTLEFRHEQERGLVYEGMTLARRRLLHRRVAAALGARDRGEQQAAVIASHLALAGDEAGAAELYGTAGDRARALYANAEALGHYRAALALGHPDPAALHAAIGDLETLAGDYGGALASYQAAAAMAGPELAPEVEHRIGVLHLRRGEWELAEASLAAALCGLEGAAAARATADRSLGAHRRGDADEAAALAADALALAEEAGDPRARAQAHNVLGIVAASRGESEDAVRQLEQALALARSADDHAAEAAALNNLALAVAAAGETERAIELTRAGLARAEALGDRHRAAALRNRLADLLHAAGRDDEAMPELKAAVALFAEVGEQGKLEPEIWKLSEW